MNKLFYFTVRFLLWISFKIYFRISYFDIDRIPRQGKLIVAANHQSYLDPPVMAVSTTRRLNFFARDDLFGFFLFGRIIKMLGAFPVRRGKIDRAALAEAVKLLNQGEAVLVFPQGTRQDKISLEDIRSGVGFLARATGALVVPASIRGTGRAFPRKAKFPRPYKIKVRFGRPLQLKDEDIQHFSRRVTESILEL